MAFRKRVLRVNTVESDSDDDTTISTRSSHLSRTTFQRSAPQASGTHIKKQAPSRKRNRLTFIGGIEADSDNEFEVKTTAVSGAPGRINIAYQAYPTDKKPRNHEKPCAPPSAPSDIPSSPSKNPEPLKRNQVCLFRFYVYHKF